MITKDKHQKHTALTKPTYGEFHRNELAILGTSCSAIRNLVSELAVRLSASYKSAYVDKEHGNGEGEAPPMVQFMEKDHTSCIDSPRPLSAFDRRRLFNSEDLVFINGNHFRGQHQILVLDPQKNVENKLDRLTDVRLVLLNEKNLTLPAFVKERLPDWQQIPVLQISEIESIAGWVKGWLMTRIPPVNGLVLAGGESRRMQKDKGELKYYGTSQREHVQALLRPLCSATYLSCNPSQATAIGDKAGMLIDTFQGLGPMGGILSAFRKDPNGAWLTVACDLPLLTSSTLQYLIKHRNPSKLATAFFDSDAKFPEPLVTLWEPRAYAVLLEYLSQGYSCPRKVLINSDVELLTAPDPHEFYNVNNPDEYEKVVQELKVSGGKTG